MNINPNGLLLTGEAAKIHTMLSDYLKAGINNNSIIPYFCYNGKCYITKLSQSYNNIRNLNITDKVEEIISDGFYSGVVISRDSQFPNTRVSMIFHQQEEGDGITIFTPRLIDIFIGIEYLCNYYNSRTYLGIIKDINHNLSLSTDFNVKDIILKYKNKEEIDNEVVYIEFKTWIRTNLEVFFNIIKHIMISEDLKYPEPEHAGRYQMQLAIIDFIRNGISLDDVLSKYNLKSS